MMKWNVKTSEMVNTNIIDQLLFRYWGQVCRGEVNRDVEIATG